MTDEEPTDEERTERVAAGYVPPSLPVARMVESPDEERGYVAPPPPPPPPPASEE